MTSTEHEHATYFLERMSSPDVQIRALALRSMAARPIADRRLLARAEALLSDTTICILFTQFPREYGELRFRAVQTVGALRAALNELEPVELRGVPEPLTLRQLRQLADKHGVRSVLPGEAGALDCMQVLQQRGLLPTCNPIDLPAMRIEENARFPY